ncbi:unnamed protein product [Ranitomeya imitator]|uniref:Matrin-type domain-containing protein n=1 Tax=Ranitomeya imitator TaxID=111125 RepID=A0ABN9LRB6_9NEOB|nr:unnamed protein product [Ranitomeya imitator]
MDIAAAIFLKPRFELGFKKMAAAMSICARAASRGHFPEAPGSRRLHLRTRGLRKMAAPTEKPLNSGERALFLQLRSAFGTCACEKHYATNGNISKMWGRNSADPYFMKNHLGSYECKLCLTLHNNEGSYLAHTQGKKHQTNLARRAAKEAKEAPAQPAPEKVKVEVKKFVKIGRPGYKVTKQRDSESGQQSLLFQIDYPEISETIMPRHRFMSAYEQRIEPPDRRWQYLLMAAEPYETIAFKVCSVPH